MTSPRYVRAATAATLLVALLVVVVGLVGVGIASSDSTTDGASTLQADDVSEDEFAEPVPEEDDPYFEAEADDGSWISYVNPRDEYRSPYLGDGSGKICVTLLNEAGDPVVGESVPDTTVTVPTGDSLAWHTSADPFVVEYPLTENYDRPLDADQFGTTDDLPQGDGYLDSHCLEWHGLPEDETVEYGEVQIEGADADDVELVGYVQQAHDSWDSDVDPIDDAEPYEEAGGWTYHEDGSHGQAVVVLQLDGIEDASDGDGEPSGDDGSDDGADDDGTGSDGGSNSSGADDGEVDDADVTPGFGSIVGLAALVALVATALARHRLD